MKSFALLLFLFILSHTVYGQDIIVRHSGDEVASKVLEITTDAIKYKKYDFLEGPIRNISKSDVFMIIYENGKREIFKNEQETKPVLSNSNIENENISKTEASSFNQNIFFKQLNKYNEKGNYFSLSLGYGNSYGGLGGRMQFVTGGKIKLGFHGGGGVLLKYSGDTRFLYSGGIQVYFWKQLYANAQFGAFGITYEEFFSSYYDEYHKKAGLLIGPSILIGYDWFFSKHFGINLGGGASLDINSDTGIWLAADGGLVIRF